MTITKLLLNSLVVEDSDISQRARNRDAARAIHINCWYSRFVSSAKIVMLATASLLTVIILLWPSIQQELGGFTADQPLGRYNKMIHPRISGVDNQNRPYSVTGQSSSSDSHKALGGGGIIILDTPEGELMLENGAWLTIRANYGEIDCEHRLITLREKVIVARDDGYSFTTEEAFLDLDTWMTWGNLPIAGHGPSGEVVANAFRIEGQGSTIVLTGKTQLFSNQNLVR